MRSFKEEKDVCKKIYFDIFIAKDMSVFLKMYQLLW